MVLNILEIDKIKEKHKTESSRIAINPKTIEWIEILFFEKKQPKGEILKNTFVFNLKENRLLGKSLSNVDLVMKETITSITNDLLKLKEES